MLSPCNKCHANKVKVIDSGKQVMGKRLRHYGFCKQSSFPVQIGLETHRKLSGFSKRIGIVKTVVLSLRAPFRRIQELNVIFLENLERCLSGVWVRYLFMKEKLVQKDPALIKFVKTSVFNQLVCIGNSSFLTCIEITRNAIADASRVSITSLTFSGVG